MTNTSDETNISTDISTDEKEKMKNKNIIYKHISKKNYCNYFYNILKNNNYILTNYINKHIMYVAK